MTEKSTGFYTRTMIACVTFETAKVVEPLEHIHGINKVHLIHYVRDKSEDSKKSVYIEFYDEVKNRIEKMGGITVVEHNEKVSDFSEMLRTVLSILQSGKNEEFCVNISAGSSEYTAAALIASMMVPGTKPFSVSTKKYTVSDDAVRDLYYKDGKPVGLTEATYPPVLLSSYPIEMPKEHLVRGLRVLEGCISSKRTSSRYMVEALKEAKLWQKTDGEAGKDPQRQRQTDAVNYSRDFMEPWIKNEWVAKSGNSKIPKITDDGKRIMRTFYADGLA